MPVISEKTGQPEIDDEDGSPIEADDTATPAFAKFMPWETAVINGKVRPAGLQNLMVPMSRVVKQYPTAAELQDNPAGYGGYLGRLIYSHVLATEKQSNPNAKADEAWGWLPPPLVGEGRKVQTGWLHEFLLDPYPIRPAVVLRMPKFNMSSAEAARWWLISPRSTTPTIPTTSTPGRAKVTWPKRRKRKTTSTVLPDALKIVTDNNYCVKCHLIGDFEPAGSNRAKGPRLDQVYKRLRPDYLLRWIARPPRILPYTSMPVNIPPDKPVSDTLYPGSSLEQVNGLVDLLLNWDRFMENRTSIKPMIKPAPAAPADNPKADAGNPPADENPQAAVEPAIPAGGHGDAPGGVAMNSLASVQTRPIGAWRLLSLALVVVLSCAVGPGCGKQPPPPPGAEEKTDPLEVDLGNNTESGREAAGHVTPPGEAPPAKEESSDESGAKPDADEDTPSTDSKG